MSVVENTCQFCMENQVAVSSSCEGYTKRVSLNTLAEGSAVYMWVMKGF
jgi:hypothetical protein